MESDTNWHFESDGVEILEYCEECWQAEFGDPRVVELTPEILEQRAQEAAARERERQRQEEERRRQQAEAERQEEERRLQRAEAARLAEARLAARRAEQREAESRAAYWKRQRAEQSARESRERERRERERRARKERADREYAQVRSSWLEHYNKLIAALPEDVRLAMRDASERIRGPRVAYDRRVVVESDRFDVRFDPVLVLAGDPLVRFEIEFVGGGEVRGMLQLDSAVFPPIEGLRFDNPRQVGVACAVALLTFADLVSIPKSHQQVAPPRRSAASGQRPHSPTRAVASEHLLKPRTSQSWHAERFQATGHTRNLHWVAGFVRHLPEGQTHTERAAAEAAGHGIIVGPSETWVSPHARGKGGARGLKEGEPLTWRWATPETLRHALSAVSSGWGPPDDSAATGVQEPRSPRPPHLSAGAVATEPVDEAEEGQPRTSENGQ